MSMFNFIGICWSEDFSMPITHNIYLDPITPGWRKGEGYSSAIEGWSEQVNPASFEDFFIILWLICCKATTLECCCVQNYFWESTHDYWCT